MFKGQRLKTWKTAVKLIPIVILGIYTQASFGVTKHGGRQLDQVYPLENCGGLVHVKHGRGPRYRVIISASERCSNVTLNKRNFKLDRVGSYYYFDQKVAVDRHKLRVSLSSNSGRTQDFLKFRLGKHYPKYSKQEKECRRNFASFQAIERCSKANFRSYSLFSRSLKQCQSHFRRGGTQLQCLESVSGVSRPVALIEHCKTYFDGKPNELKCLQEANKYRWPVALVNQCQNIFDGDHRELECLRKVAHLDFNAKEPVSLCESTFDGDNNEMSCVNILSKANYDISDIIRNCDRLYSRDARELGCVKERAQRWASYSKT